MLTRRIALPIALAAALFGGLALGAADISTSTVHVSTSPDVSAPTTDTAWDMWDHGGASAKMRVVTNRAYRVDFMGATTDYPKDALAEDAVAVGKDGRWYWFRLTYTS
jgi:hypothetical protein